MGQVGLGSAFGARSGRAVCQVNYFIQQPHLTEPTDVPFMHFSTGTGVFCIFRFGLVDHFISKSLFYELTATQDM